ncbi:MAG TPA: anti-sigma factor [Microbacterium sp.]|nr:anti-sigma factor [Microbacterium sp.]
MNEKEFAELAAGHALGALSADDERSFEAALVAHPEWASLVDADMAVVARLADIVGDVQPPPALKSALFARLDDAPATSAAPPAETARAEKAPEKAVPARASRRGGRVSRTWFALAASVALLLAVGIGATSLVQTLTRPASVVALERIEDAPDAQQAQAQITGGGDATLHWSPSLGEAVLVSDGLPTLASDQTYELWYVRGDEPISAGTFDASSGSTTAVLEAGIQPGDAVAVTVEQAGGSPDGTPTTDPIIVISTA